jgi:hypothetical protein
MPTSAISLNRFQNFPTQRRLPLTAPAPLRQNKIRLLVLQTASILFRVFRVFRGPIQQADGLVFFRVV